MGWRPDMTFTRACEGTAVRQGRGGAGASAPGCPTTLRPPARPPRLVGSKRELRGKAPLPCQRGACPGPPGPHHPGFGAEARLAVGLKHPAVVGEQQLQHLAAKPNAQDPEAGGEEQGAEQGLLAEVEVAAAAGGTRWSEQVSGWRGGVFPSLELCKEGLDSHPLGWCRRVQYVGGVGWGGLDDL